MSITTLNDLGGNLKRHMSIGNALAKSGKKISAKEYEKSPADKESAPEGSTKDKASDKAGLKNSKPKMSRHEMMVHELKKGKK